MNTKIKDKKSFNHNTSLGEIIKYCKDNNKIFEVNEKGFMLFDLIPNPEKEKDKISLGKVFEVHVKNQGKKAFSDFGIKQKRITKKEKMLHNLINVLVDLNKVKEHGYYKNAWGEKFPYKKLFSGELIVYYPDNKRVKMVINNFGVKNYLRG